MKLIQIGFYFYEVRIVIIEQLEFIVFKVRRVIYSEIHQLMAGVF